MSDWTSALDGLEVAMLAPASHAADVERGAPEDALRRAGGVPASAPRTPLLVAERSAMEPLRGMLPGLDWERLRYASEAPSREELAKTEKEFKRISSDVWSFVLDVTDAAAVYKLADKISNIQIEL